MEVTCFLPYYDYNDSAFEVNDDYYGDGDDYINAVSEEYNKNKDVVFNSMLDVKNGSQSLLIGQDGQTYKFGQKTSQNEDKVAYSSCGAVLYGNDGEGETVDGFIDKFAKQESFIEMVELNGETIEEEFESEMNLWVKEHNNISKYKDKLGEEWVWSKEPKRNIKVLFKNNANEDVYAMLHNCKIMDIIDGYLFILFVEKMTLVDK